MKLDNFFDWVKRNHPDISDPGLLEEVFMDDPEFAVSLMQTAMDSVKQYKATIDDDTISSNDRRFYLAVHSLKSTVANLGMQMRAETLQRLETQLKEEGQLSAGQHSRLQEDVNEILVRLQDLYQHINDFK